MSRRLRLPPGAAKWTPFEFAKGLDRSPEQIAAIAAHAGVTPDIVRAEVDRLNEAVIVQNSRYQVHIMRVPVPGVPGGYMQHLSIRRLDRKRPGAEKWRDFQRLKNELCGAESEAVEMYPRESRLIDGADQYHLWVLPWGVNFPFGFDGGRDVSYTAPPGGTQTPLEA